MRVFRKRVLALTMSIILAVSASSLSVNAGEYEGDETEVVLIETDDSTNGDTAISGEDNSLSDGVDMNDNAGSDESETPIAGDINNDTDEGSQITEMPTDNNDSVSEQNVAEPYENEQEDVYYTIDYVAEDSDVMDMPVDFTSYKKGTIAGIVKQEPKRPGYIFLGWSPTGDPSELYTHGWSFEMTEDITLYAVWSSAEEENYNVSNGSNPRVKAINTYVKSLKGRFNPVFKINNKVRSWQCCAFTDSIWKNVFGISRWDKNKKFTIINSKKKIGGKKIYQFLKETNAQPGDIIWVHDPSYAENYNITHYMILMGYDENGLIITDGYEKNGKGIVWKNNQRVSFTGDHAKYFSGKCYVRLYHLKNSVQAVN